MTIFWNFQIDTLATACKVLGYKANLLVWSIIGWFKNYHTNKSDVSDVLCQKPWALHAYKLQAGPSDPESCSIKQVFVLDLIKVFVLDLN